MPKTASIIIIGNEILSGRIEDANSSFLARELRKLGVKLRRIAVIPDEVEAIAGEVSRCAASTDFVFTAGGVGPTHDDVTMEGVARGLGMRTVLNPRLAEILRTECGAEAAQASMRMAELPEEAEVLQMEGLRFPPVVVRNVYIFPGIPEYLRAKFEAIKDRFRAAPFLMKKIYVAGEECFVAEHLHRVVDEFPRVLVGSYPAVNVPGYKVVVTLEALDPDALERAEARLLALIPEELVVKTE
jgi:FAD synthetase